VELSSRLSRRRVPRLGVVLCTWLFVASAIPAPAQAFSVLAHQNTVDALWASDIVPLLRQRFRGITDAQLNQARAHAYGGSLIQDLGYYPFGSHLFTNLTHYVRSGDFVGSLLRNAADVNEYAFALGALAHYAADNTGHPLAVNRSVPMMYPKVRAKTGPVALYTDSPARHVMVEFAFDVLQVARGGYVAQAYRDRIGFEVSKDLLERAVRETYAIDLDDMLLSVDLAIGTYRKAVSSTLPELTRIAWRDKRDEIEARTPGITEAGFVYTYTPADYHREFGTTYRKPGFLARTLGFLLKVVPKIGPFRPLAFEPLTADVERLFLESVEASRGRYRGALQTLRERTLQLPNTDFDTGQPPARGKNALADETYADLLHKLAGRRFADVSPELRAHLNGYFGDSVKRAQFPDPDNDRRIRVELTALNQR
jgi:hypothetical protein